MRLEFLLKVVHAISMANITNQEMLSSKAKQTADREPMRLKRGHQDVLSEWQLELQVVREKYWSALESYEITKLVMEKICDPVVKASVEDQAVATAMVHGELMQKAALEGTVDMYLNLSENVRNGHGVDSREVAREMMKAHLKKVRGMAVQDKEMEKTRQAAKKKLKSDGIPCAAMGNVSSGDWEADLVAKKTKKSKGRRVLSSDDESADEAPSKPKKKTVYSLAYLFQKGLVDEWGAITAKGKEKSEVEAVLCNRRANLMWHSLGR